MLRLHKSREIWLPPPQFYEINRLNCYPQIDTVINFAKERNGKDIPLILPINFTLRDSLALVYPGDDLYPKDANPFETSHDNNKFKEKTYQELEENCTNFCRIELKDMSASNFKCNVNDGFLPIQTEQFKGKM